MTKNGGKILQCILNRLKIYKKHVLNFLKKKDQLILIFTHLPM